MGFQKAAKALLVLAVVLCTHAAANNINAGGQKGLIRAMTTETHGLGALTIGGAVKYDWDKYYAIGPQMNARVHKLSTNSYRPRHTARLYSTDLHLVYGLHQAWDVGVDVPLYYDQTGWDDEGHFSVGNLELSTKLAYPFNQEVFFINHAYFIRLILPTGNEDEGYFSRHAYYISENEDPAKDKFRSNTWVFNPMIIWSMHFDRLNPAIPLKLHANFGGALHASFTAVAALGIEYSPLPPLSFFLEISGESRVFYYIDSFSFTYFDNDVFWLTPGLRLTFNNGMHLEGVKTEIEKAQRDYDLNKAAELQYSRVPQLEKEIQEAEQALKDEKNRLMKEEVTEEDIASIISRWTKIPVEKLVEGEKEKLLSLEKHLHRRVIGQDEAVNAVSEAVLQARAGMKDPAKPIGSFIFLGPTGVGKTELARTLAHSLFDDENAVVRIDMSEYMEKHAVSRLIGAPPGYVGYDEGGQLTEAVRRRPYSVLLFDEIEKAHHDVFNILLQILDDGRLTDSHGRVVNFKNTIIIMTSNIGSTHIVEQSEKPYEAIRKTVLGELRHHFHPEFLNRVDEIVVFHALNKEHILEIVGIQLERLAERLREKNISLEVSQRAKELLAEEGFDVIYGARPLKRTIRRRLEAPLSRKLIEGTLQLGSPLEVDEADGELSLSTKQDNLEYA